MMEPDGAEFKGGDKLLLKQVVVVYKSKGIDGTAMSDRMEFEAKRDFLHIINNENRQLIIEDIDDKTGKWDTLAVFNTDIWEYWKEKKDAS